MSQFDFGVINPATKSGTALAADLMAWRDAVHSGHRGNTAPTYAAAGLEWIDDTLDPLWVLKRYDGTAWIATYAIDTTTNQASSINVGERLRYPVAGGTANALTLTPAVATTAYLDTDVVTLEAAANNSAAATLNVSGVGAKAIRKIVGGADVAIVVGDILAAGRYKFNYKAAAAAGAGAWILTNPSTSSGLGFGSSNAASATDLSKHIALFSTTHGFSVTANRINYVAPTGVDHVYVVNGVDVGKIGGNGFTVGAPTGGAQGAGTANTKGYYEDGARLSGWKQIADVTLSGASQTISGIPADATEVEIQMIQVGASAGTNASPMLIRLGSGAGIVATGYTSGAGYGNNSAVSPTATGLIFHQSTPVNQTVITNIRLRRVPGSNFWNMSETGIFYDTGAAEVAITAGGFIDMAAVVVDRFQIATVANNNTLAGRVIVSWRT